MVLIHLVLNFFDSMSHGYSVIGEECPRAFMQVSFVMFSFAIIMWLSVFIRLG